MTTRDEMAKSWGIALEECRSRFYSMMRAKAFLYVFAAVWLFGGFGVWMTAVMNQFGAAAPRDVHLSVLTFAIAVSVSGAFDGTYPSTTSGLLRILALLFTLIASGIPAIATLMAFASESDWTAANRVVCWLYIFVAPLPSVFVWAFFNGADDRFAPDSPSSAAVGGNPMQKLI